MFNVNIFTAVIVLIMGIYDMSYAFNRRHQPNNKFGIAVYDFGYYFYYRRNCNDCQKFNQIKES